MDETPGPPARSNDGASLAFRSSAGGTTTFKSIICPTGVCRFSGTVKPPAEQLFLETGGRHGCNRPCCAASSGLRQALVAKSSANRSPASSAVSYRRVSEITCAQKSRRITTERLKMLHFQGLTQFDPSIRREELPPRPSVSAWMRATSSGAGSKFARSSQMPRTVVVVDRQVLRGIAGEH